MFEHNVINDTILKWSQIFTLNIGKCKYGCQAIRKWSRNPINFKLQSFVSWCSLSLGNIQQGEGGMKCQLYVIANQFSSKSQSDL